MSRVFHDRLVNNEDKQWFNDNLLIFLKIIGIDYKYNDIFDANTIIWGNFIKPGLERDEMIYKELTDKKQLSKVLYDYLDDYNMEHPSKMNLVLFIDAIEHISRIIRILFQPRGNSVLIGVGGSGKQSLTRLSSFIID